MLGSLFDILLFLETAILFAVVLFCVFLYVKTKDLFIRRTLFLIIPTFIIFLYSYGYSYISRFFSSFSFTHTDNWLNFTLLNAVFIVFVIGASIIGTNTYVTDLYPIPDKNKILSKRIIYVLTIIFLIIASFFTLISGNLADSMPLALNVIYPACSLLAFIHTVIILFYYKKITSEHQNRLVKNFIFAFILQFAFTFIDIFLMNQYDVSFKFTHLSYLIFALLSFYYIFSLYFNQHIEKDDEEFNFDKQVSKYDLSEREIDVLKLLLKGHSNFEIAGELYISVNTVKTHIKNIYKKTEVKNRMLLSYKFIPKDKNHPRG